MNRMNDLKIIKKYHSAILAGKMKVHRLLPDREKFLQDLERWTCLNEKEVKSDEFDNLTAFLYSQIYAFSSFSEPPYFEGHIENMELEKRVSVLETEVKSIRKDMAKLLQKFDELRKEIVISDKAKGDGYGQYN
jgi:hypothetical protein